MELAHTVYENSMSFMASVNEQPIDWIHGPGWTLAYAIIGGVLGTAWVRIKDRREAKQALYREARITAQGRLGRWEERGYQEFIQTI